MSENDNRDKLTRRDVDELAAKILINFGVINAAALGASLAKLECFSITPIAFTVGLISGVVAQILWYIQSALEQGMNKSFSLYEWLENIVDPIISHAVIISGIISGASLVFGGCFLLTGNLIFSLIVCFLLCGLPLGFIIWIANKHKKEFK